MPGIGDEQSQSRVIEGAALDLPEVSARRLYHLRRDLDDLEALQGMGERRRRRGAAAQARPPVPRGPDHAAERGR